MLVMVRNPRQKPIKRVNQSSREALRILASLIAQFHMNKSIVDKKPDIQATDIGESDNDQSLS
jgi:hypothetical protein